MPHVVCHLQRSDKNVDRVLGFMALWAANRPSARQDAADQFVEDVLWDMHALSHAQDKGVRTRACQVAPAPRCPGLPSEWMIFRDFHHIKCTAQGQLNDRSFRLWLHD